MSHLSTENDEEIPSPEQPQTSELRIHSLEAASSMSLSDVPGIRSFSDVSLHDDKGANEHSNNKQDDPVIHIVEEQNGHATAPTTLPESRRSRVLMTMVIGGLLAVLLLGLVYGFAKPQTKGDRARKAPTEAQVINYLAMESVSLMADLQRDGSPQRRAALWLVERDTARIPLPQSSILEPEGYRYMARYVLALTYFALGGTNWTTPVNFLSPEDICAWNDVSWAYKAAPNGVVIDDEIGGVRCDGKDRVPRVFDLELNNAQGTIPTELGLLTSLWVLDVAHNKGLVGSIPTQLCRLSDLFFLSLTNNAITGVLPDCLNRLSNLEILRLEKNKLTGSLPSNPGLCTMTRMQDFIVQRNAFRGSLPACMGQWSNLSRLIVSNNRLDGSIPQELQTLSSLRFFWADHNGFTGDPTAVVSAWPRLELLYLSHNKFTGVIGDSFCAQSTNLTILDLTGNRFTSGEHAIPTHLFSLSRLEVVDFAENQINGFLPRAIPRNDRLAFISLFRNQVRGGIPAEIANLQALLHIDLSSNSLHGDIPPALFTMSSLWNIFLADNLGFQKGPVPSELDSLTNLQELSLKRTNRNGTLPLMRNFDKLILLDFDDNDFEGRVPDRYGRLPSLRWLMLNRNPRLRGPLPEFADTTQLQILLVDGTGISGDFSSVCAAPAISGNQPRVGETVVVADCSDTDNSIQCSCCHCCQSDIDGVNGTGCSDPYVANLDYTWEARYSQMIRDFGINLTMMVSPVT